MSSQDLPTSGPSDPGHQGTCIVEPTSVHSHSIILLHGLSSTGEKFGKEFLSTGLTSSGKTLPELLPGDRWIFPTAQS